MASDIGVSKNRTSAVNPLEPLIMASRGLGLVVVGLLLVGTLAAIFGTGSVLTIGEDPICATVQSGRELVMLDTSDEKVQPVKGGLAPRVGSTVQETWLCQDRPTGLTRLFGFLEAAPPMVLLLGFLAGVFVLVRRARRTGLFNRSLD